MLRITFHKDEKPGRLQFEGKLTEPWVTEAWTAWIEAVQAGPLLADLASVTTVDPAGWKLLEAMNAVGVDFITEGVKMKALIQEMKNRIQANKGS